MPVDFLTDEQYQSYATYPGTLEQDQLDKYFYLDDKDKELIDACRRDYNKLGYALQWFCRKNIFYHNRWY